MGASIRRLLAVAALAEGQARIGQLSRRVDNGEEVVIKKRGKTKNFDLTLVSNSLTGLSINIERH